MNFQSFSTKEREKFETYLKESIVDKSGTQLEEAMRYSLEAGGKRLRPLLVLATLEAFGQDKGIGYPAALALEMIHTYSLIHDDLPAMDNDDLRRGKPTNHIQFSEATAILAGDALLTYAFECIVIGEALSDKKVRLIQLLAECSGYKGMVGGQQADINGEQADLTLEELESIHLRKTGALIRFALLAGGILADQPEAVLQILEKIAYGIGVAYQIRDDILDVIGDEAELGKATGADEKLGKSTYPALLGLEKAKERLKQELDSMKELIQSIQTKVTEFDSELLTSFVDYLYLEEKSK
jgi:geranylgeranyl diphosphate synthase type II